MNNDQMNNDQLQEDLTEVLRVRRDKLAKLQEMGRDPFKVSRYDRTSNSTEIKGNFEEFEGSKNSWSYNEQKNPRKSWIYRYTRSKWKNPMLC